MNKKSAILFFSVLVLLSLGVLYVLSDVLIHGDVLGTTNVTTREPTPWINGSDNVLMNITLGHSGLTGSNITNFTVDLGAFSDASSNLTGWNFINIGFGDATGHIPDGSNATSNLTNVTFDVNGNVFGYFAADQLVGWECYNLTEWAIYCASLDNSSQLQAYMNTSLTLVVNVTAAATSDEGAFSINITAEGDGGSGMYDTNVTNVTAYIDDQAPRLVEVNISDGNTTYANSTFGAGIYYLNGPLTIEALIEDSLLTTNAIIAYNCSGDGGITENYGAYSEDLRTITNERRESVDQRGYVTSSSLNCYLSGDRILGANETFPFAIIVNDTFNHKAQLNYSETAPLNITLDDGEFLPTIERVNVTQTTQSLTDGSSITLSLDDHDSELDGSGNDYLTANTVTFDIEVKGGDKQSNITLVWNDTGAGTTNFGPAVIGTTAGRPYFVKTDNLLEASALILDNKSAVAIDDPSSGVNAILANTTTVVYSATLSLAGNSTNQFAFYVYANNTGNNYTRIGGSYRFTVDGTAPSITMTAPTDRTINPRGSITYTCKASENAASGAYRIMWQLKKPSETLFTTKQTYVDITTDGTDSITFTGGDTNLAGDYDVRCLAIDHAGNEGVYTTSSTENFAVHYSTAEGAAEGAAAAADIDLSIAEEITITEKQGTISTFTLDGTTVHTIKIKTVDEIAGTVTIVIESDPIEITLKIGETKEVDIDADGANDISVTLNKITEGLADITTKRLTPLPEKEVPTEEVPPTEKPAEEITPTEEAASKTWLWILIIVIIVVIGVGYWFMKKK